MSLDDFRKPVHLFVVEGERRDWRTLWLRKRVVRRMIFAGFITSWTRDGYGNSFVLEDGTTRYRLTPGGTAA